MSDQWLFEDSDAFISVSLYKNVLIEIIKPETPYRVMEDGSLRPQITHTEPNWTWNVPVGVTGAAAGRNAPETQPEQ